MKILGVLVLAVLISVIEIWLAFDSFQGAKPFPWNEVLYISADHIARDILVLAIGTGVYVKRRVLFKSIKDFCPVAVIGTLYLCAVSFMLYRLSLDFGLQTFLSVLAGSSNNVLIVLISALAYHKWKNKTTKCLYFVSYVFTGLVIITDLVYFWQTTTHVESVLFQNLNIYSIIAVINSFDTSIVIALLLVTIAIVCISKTVGGKTEVVNFKKVASIILGAVLLINVVDYACSIAPIPLIFVSKNLLPLNNLRNNVFASQIDLAPTLLHLLGIEKPSLFVGRNLLEPRDKTYALGYFEQLCSVA